MQATNIQLICFQRRVHGCYLNYCGLITIRGCLNFKDFFGYPSSMNLYS